MPLTVSA